MRSEKEIMLAGELYNSADPSLLAERLHARELCQELNALPAQTPPEEQAALLTKLFRAATDVQLTPPFFLRLWLQHHTGP